jgi:hypothetical protein
MTDNPAPNVEYAYLVFLADSCQVYIHETTDRFIAKCSKCKMVITFHKVSNELIMPAVDRAKDWEGKHKALCGMFLREGEFDGFLSIPN